PGVNDGDVSHQADPDVVDLEIRDRGRLSHLLEKSGTIDERSVRERTEEIIRQNLLEPADVRGLNRPDELPVPVGKPPQISGRSRVKLHGILPCLQGRWPLSALR